MHAPSGWKAYEACIFRGKGEHEGGGDLLVGRDGRKERIDASGASVPAAAGRSAGATTGKSYLIKKPPLSVFASYLIRLRVNTGITPEYLWGYLKSPMYWNQITVVKKGSAQPGANAQILGGFALPPLNEQKRIADKVERLLGKFNQAKQLIEEAKETFELRRVAILEKAFRGELTKKWRDENEQSGSVETLLQKINARAGMVDARES